MFQLLDIYVSREGGTEDSCKFLHLSLYERYATKFTPIPIELYGVNIATYRSLIAERDSLTLITERQVLFDNQKKTS